MAASTGPMGRGIDSASAGPAGRADLLDLTATEAVAAMTSGDLQAEAYGIALLERARALRFLNTMISQDADRFLEAARERDKLRRAGGTMGPLHGLPLLIKDNINTVDLPTTAGTPALRNHRPVQDAAVVRAVLRSGGILFGKTNMQELAFGITSNNGAFGPVRNPYDPSKIAGGSSGGNGAALAARIAPASIGTDTGGSTRIPAALCGIVGFRPTVGRYPSTGRPFSVTTIVPISHTADTPGPMARSGADVALLDAVITGQPLALEPARLAGLRLGVARSYFFDNLDPQLATVIEDALRRLRERGAVLVEANIPDLSALNAAVGPMVAFEAPRALARYLTANKSRVTLSELISAIASPDVKGILEAISGPRGVPETVYADVLNVHRPRLQAAYEQYFRSHGIGAMIFPTTPLPARPIGQDQTVELNARQVSTFFTYIRNTAPGANAGIPGLSVPVGLTRDGLPVGLELDAPPGTDRALLAIGMAVEVEFGRLPAPPPERLRGR